MSDTLTTDIRFSGKNFAAVPPPLQSIYHLKRANNAKRSGAMTFSCLGKIAGTGSVTLGRWKTHLEKVFRAACRHRPITRAPLIIGLAESGIIPSALFHQIVHERCPSAVWVCSTRRASAGIPFSERHSHAPDHILPYPETRPTELWFVEDEITTGQTLLSLTLSLCRRMNLQSVRYVVFTDIRTSEMRRQFSSILAENGITFSVHALFPEHLSRTACKPDNTQLIAMTSSRRPARSEASPPSSGVGWCLPNHRPALKGQFHSNLRLPTGLHGSLLAVGEAVDLGVRTVQANPGLQLHHITLSPWEVDGINIHHRLGIGDAYYLYNFHTLRPPLHILNDPVEESVAEAAEKQLKAVGLETRRLRFGRAPD